MGVAAFALQSISDRDLVDALTALETNMRQDYSRMLAMVYELDSRGVATSRGYSNIPALLLHTLRITRADAGLKAEMTLTVSLDFLHNALDDALLPGQSYLTARDARLAACDARVLPAVMDGDSKPLDIAVPAYVVPAHIRRALVLRDRGCAFPACDRPASVCDSHHIYSWLKGGPTQLGNLVLLCPHHHRLVHRSGWEVKLVNNTPWFTPPPFVDLTRKPRRNHLHHTT
jgi:HNH endonuclease